MCHKATVADNFIVTECNLKIIGEDDNGNRL